MGRSRSRSPPPKEETKVAVAAAPPPQPLRTALLGSREYTLNSPELGLLQDSSELLGQRNFGSLRTRLKEDGYLFLKGLLPADAVAAAQHQVLELFRDQGMLAAGDSDQGRLRGTEALCQQPEIKACLEHEALRRFFGDLFGRRAVTYDFKWLRAVRRGQSSGFHMDTVYMGNCAAPNLLTCWIPLMTVPLELGGLTVCRGSCSLPTFAPVRESYGRLDLDSGDVGGTGWFSEDPEEVAHFGGQWQTADFAPGDVVVFNMHTMHGSSVNQTSRWRLSFDVRWQPEDEPLDSRWMRRSADGVIPGDTSRWALHRDDPVEFPRTMNMAKRDWGLMGSRRALVAEAKDDSLPCEE